MTSHNDLGTVLSIWAHPGDATWLAAGVMADARDRGQRVVCAVASAGVRTSTGRSLWPPDRLDVGRPWEMADSMGRLGIAEHSIASFAEGALPRHSAEGVAWAHSLIAETEPDTILTFGRHGRSQHLDHIAVHEWVTAAWHQADHPGQLLYATPVAEVLEGVEDFYESWDMCMASRDLVGVARAELALHLALSGEGLDRKAGAFHSMLSGDVVSSHGPDHRTLMALLAEEGFMAARPEPALILPSWSGRKHPELPYLQKAAWTRQHHAISDSRLGLSPPHVAARRRRAR